MMKKILLLFLFAAAILPGCKKETAPFVYYENKTWKKGNIPHDYYIKFDELGHVKYYTGDDDGKLIAGGGRSGFGEIEKIDGETVFFSDFIVECSGPDRLIEKAVYDPSSSSGIHYLTIFYRTDTNTEFIMPWEDPRYIWSSELETERFSLIP